MDDVIWRARRPTGPGSDKTVPLDHNEVFGPMQPANLVVIADHFTERAGGRPHTDVRLANLFDPCLVKLRLTDAVGCGVENPVTDLGSDPAPVSHGCSRSRIWMSFLTLRTPVSSATITSAASRSVLVPTDPVRVMAPSFAVASTPSGTAPPRVSASLAMAARLDLPISSAPGSATPPAGRAGRSRRGCPRRSSSGRTSAAGCDARRTATPGRWGAEPGRKPGRRS